MLFSIIFIVSTILSIALYLIFNKHLKTKDFHITVKLRPLYILTLFITIESFLLFFCFVILPIFSRQLKGHILVSILLYSAIIFIGFLIFFINNFKAKNPLKETHDFIVYLRSFQSDTDKHGMLEKNLVNLLSNIYPVYAIGKPDELLPKIFRAKRVYKTDDDWKSTVIKFIEKSKYIILQLDGTEGVSWEFNKCQQYKEKVLFIAGTSERFYSFFEKNKLFDYSPESFEVPKQFPVVFFMENNSLYFSSVNNINQCYELLTPFVANQSQNQILTEKWNLIFNTTRYFGSPQYRLFYDTYLFKQFKVPIKIPIWCNILFFFFPYNFFYGLFSGMIVNAWMFAGFTIGMTQVLTIGYINKSDLNTKMQLYSALILLPFAIIGSIYGPKIYWKKFHYLGERNFIKRIKQKSIIYSTILLLLITFSVHGRYQQIQEYPKREAERVRIETMLRESGYYERKYQDSIFFDKCASKLLCGVWNKQQVDSAILDYNRRKLKKPLNNDTINEPETQR